ITGSQGSGERNEDLLKRIIPGPENERQTKRLLLHPAPSGLCRNRSMDIAWLQPAAQIAPYQPYLRTHHKNVNHSRLSRAAAQVSFQRCQHCLLMIGDESQESIELSLTPVERTVMRALVDGFPQSFKPGLWSGSGCCFCFDRGLIHGIRSLSALA